MARSVEEVVGRYFECLNGEDWAGLAELFAERAELVAVGSRPRSGREEVLDYYRRALAPYPEHRDEPTRVLVAEGTATVEIRYRGATPEGRPVEFDAVDVFDVEHGRIERLTSWYDIADVRRQLAGEPPPGGDRDGRLRELVRHAARRSPFYARRFREAGVSPEQIRGAGDLARLPLTRYLEDFVACPGDFLAVPPEQVVQLHATSGTVSGLPQPVRLSRADLAEAGRLCARGLALAGVGPEDVVQLLAPLPAVEDAVPLVGAQVIPFMHSTALLDQLVLAARGLGATVLVGSPSLFAAFRARAGELGFGLAGSALRLVLLGGEPWSEPYRRALEAELRCRFADVYGLTEAGLVGVECPERIGLHVLADEHVVEIVAPETGALCPPGEAGEIVVTPLTRRAMPLLRYCTGDMAAWLDGPCPCGSALPRTTRIRGRVEHRLEAGGAPLFPGDVEEAVHAVLGVGSEWQVVVGSGEVRVRVEAEDAEALAGVAGHLRRSTGGEGIELEAVAPGTLPRELRFKAQRLVRR